METSSTAILLLSLAGFITALAYTIKNIRKLKSSCCECSTHSRTITRENTIAESTV